MARKLRPDELPDFSDAVVAARQTEETDADRFLRELAQQQNQPLDLTSESTAWFNVFIPGVTDV
jgi:hypothetical protein